MGVRIYEIFRNGTAMIGNRRGEWHSPTRDRAVNERNPGHERRAGERRSPLRLGGDISLFTLWQRLGNVPDVKFDGLIHHRRTIRLRNWDYAASGAYFITLCTQRRRLAFGGITDDEMVLNSMGLIVKSEWLRSEEIRSEVNLDEFVVMPNHLHAIVFLDGVASEPLDWKPRGFTGATPRSLSSLVQGFKSATTKRVNALRSSPGGSIWKRDYYERVLRNDRELNRAREYIRDNPRKWAEDKNNPANAA